MPQPCHPPDYTGHTPTPDLPEDAHCARCRQALDGIDDVARFRVDGGTIVDPICADCTAPRPGDEVLAAVSDLLAENPTVSVPVPEDLWADNDYADVDVTVAGERDAWDVHTGALIVTVPAVGSAPARRYRLTVAEIGGGR